MTTHTISQPWAGESISAWMDRMAVSEVYRHEVGSDARRRAERDLEHLRARRAHEHTQGVVMAAVIAVVLAFTGWWIVGAFHSATTTTHHTALYMQLQSQRQMEEACMRDLEHCGEPIPSQAQR